MSKGRMRVPVSRISWLYFCAQRQSDDALFIVFTFFILLCTVNLKHLLVSIKTLLNGSLVNGSHGKFTTYTHSQKTQANERGKRVPLIIDWGITVNKKH